VAKSKKAESSGVLDLPCEFSGVSIGDGTANIGLRISKQLLNIMAAEEALCGRRLNGTIFRCPPGADPNQTSFEFGPETDSIESVFDVKRFSSSPKFISFGLTFSLQEIDAEVLSHFAKASGRVRIDQVQAIAPPEKKEKKAQPLPLQRDLNLGDDEPWRGYMLKNLFKGKVLESLHDAKMDTMGQLADWQKDARNHLEDLPGIGVGQATKIADTVARAFEEKPWEAKV
jgi:hypothetical protein